MRYSALTTASFCGASILGFALIGATSTLAQQKQSVKFEAPAANTKYTQQQSIAVGDVAGHEFRIFENIRTFPKDPLIIDGISVKEWWTRGSTDYIETNGVGTAYHTLIMESGDKIFARANFVAQSAVSADGKKGANNLVAGPITGGTGKFLGIRGMLRFAATFDTKLGVNDSKGEIEYWIEK